jgi:hypothetical protein
VIEPSGKYSKHDECIRTAAKLNSAAETAKRQTWGRFSCVHGTAIILRTHKRPHGW